MESFREQSEIYIYRVVLNITSALTRKHDKSKDPNLVKNHEIKKKAPAQPELSSRSDFRACFVVVVRISFDPVTSTILEQDLREF